MTPGIYYGLTFAEYRAIPAWNWSLIKLMDPETGSPLHCKHAKDNPDDGDTTSRVKLRAVHSAVLEPERFGQDFVIYPGEKNRNSNEYKDFAKQYEGTGKAVLMPKEYDQEMAPVKATADAVRSHPAAARLLSKGRGEVTVVWVDKATGLPCKARIDWLGPGWFFDLKTFGTTVSREVARMVARANNHGQLAHYAAGLHANGLDLPAYLVVAEGKGAQDVAVFNMDSGAPDGPLHVGAVKRAEYMARLAECVATDEWPGRHPDVVDLQLPNYALLYNDDLDMGDLPEED